MKVKSSEVLFINWRDLGQVIRLVEKLSKDEAECFVVLKYPDRKNYNIGFWSDLKAGAVIHWFGMGRLN